MRQSMRGADVICVGIASKLLALALGFLCVMACGEQKPAAREVPDGPARTTSPATEAATSATREVTLMLNWFPEMEHGGFYAASVAGEYEARGLTVKIVPGGAGTPVVPALAAGRVDFGVMNADNLLQARAQGMPLIALMAPIQTSPRCIIVQEASGITALEQLRGVTLAMNVSNAFAVYLQKHAPLEDVRLVPYSGSVAQFLLEKNFAQQGYTFSEPYLIRQQGGQPRVLPLADIGFNPYTSILVAREELLASDPQLVLKMTQASRRGWELYFEDPAPANATIHTANPEMGLDVLEFGAETLRPLSITSDTQRMGLGAMTEARWGELQGQLEEIGMIDRGKLAPADAYTNRFMMPGDAPAPEH